MIRTFQTFVLAALLPGSSGVAAESLTRDDAIRRALTHNRQLAVASLEIDRAQARFRWAGRLDNPELEVSRSTDQLGLNDDEGGVEMAFQQRFPVTSRLRDEKRVRRHDVALAELEVKMRQRQLAYEVDKAWIELGASQRAVEARSSLLELSREMAAFLEDRVRVGEASSLDATQAALSGKMIEQEIEAGRASIESARLKLGYLIGMDPETPLSTIGELSLPPLAPPETVDLQAALRHRPDHDALLLAGGELGEARLALALAERWDDIEFEVFVGSERAVDEPDGLERNTIVGFGLSIPLPLFDRNEQAIEEARIDLETVRRARAAKFFEIHSQLKRALRERRMAYDLLQAITTDALPLARKNLEDFRTAQQSGQASPLQAQEAQAQHLRLKASALEQRRRYELLDAEVRFLSGTYPIPHFHSTAEK